MGVLDYLKPGRLNANAVYYLGGISQFFPGLQVPAKQDRLNRCWTPIVMLYARPIDLLEPKQFKNNLIMFEDKPQFEFAA